MEAQTRWRHKLGGRTNEVDAQMRWTHKQGGCTNEVDAQSRWMHKVGRRPETDPCGAARILRERSNLKF